MESRSEPVRVGRRAPRLLTDLLDAGGDQDISLISAGSYRSYGQLRTQVRNAAAALSRWGLRPGERVLLALPQEASFVTALFATWCAGGVVVPIDHRSPAEQIVKLTRDCQAVGILCDDFVFSKIEERLSEVSSLRFAVVTSGRLRSSRAGINIIRYDDAVAFKRSDPTISSDPGALAAITYTSGSTGRPKGAMHSHASLLSSLVFTHKHLALGRDDRILISFPLYHLFALRVLLAHLMVGATVIVAADIFAGLKDVQETRPNALILVPAACALLVEKLGAVLAQCAPLVRRVCIGSAAISPALLDRLQRLLPEAKIHIPYGMTEARIGFLEPVDGRAERRLCATDPNLELRVLDESGVPVKAGIGELVLRGPALMMGYWHNSDFDNEILRGEGFHTRDLMEVTEEGDRFLVGRLDDVINVGGEKVYPCEVEAVLLAHPCIRDAKVTGEADPRGIRGQVVSADIVLASNGEFDRDEILAHCRVRLEPCKLPSILRPVPEIARNEMGKVVKVSST